MAITRIYSTREECARLFTESAFDNFPSWVVTDNPDFYEHWEFFDNYGGDWLEEEERDADGLKPCDPPMWSTWFIPADSYWYRWIEDNADTVANCGFTLIYYDGDLFALGIDGAGYDFREAHWQPLYDATGLTWHIS